VSTRSAVLARGRAFLFLWTIATLATVTAFVLHLAFRGKTVSLGYELGRARADQDRLREVKRVLQVEAASYKTPERVEIVARTLLGMEPPSSDRIIPLPAIPDSKSDSPSSARSMSAAATRASESALVESDSPP
jgi:cell division protein FtsL